MTGNSIVIQRRVALRHPEARSAEGPPCSGMFRYAQHDEIAAQHDRQLHRHPEARSAEGPPCWGMFRYAQHDEIAAQHDRQRHRHPEARSAEARQQELFCDLELVRPQKTQESRILFMSLPYLREI